MNEDFIPQEHLDGLEGKLGEAPKPSAEPEYPDLSPCAFSITEFGECYRLRNVPYKDCLVTVDWTSDYLDGGTKAGHGEWQQRTASSQWKLPPASLFYASIRALYRNECGLYAIPIEKVRKEFRGWILEGVHTGTSVRYSVLGQDIIRENGIGLPAGSVASKHHWGYWPHDLLFNRKSIEVVTQHSTNLVSVGALTQHLLGTDDVREIDAVFEWLYGRPLKIIRRQNSPFLPRRSPVIIYSDSYNGGVSLDCRKRFGARHRAVGVRIDGGEE